MAKMICSMKVCFKKFLGLPLGIVFFVIGVGMDIGVMVTKRHLVVVSNDYMGIVYTTEGKMSICIFDILSNDEICYSAVFEYFSSIKNSEMNEKQYMFILDNLCIALDEVKEKEK